MNCTKLVTSEAKPASQSSCADWSPKPWFMGWSPQDGSDVQRCRACRGGGGAQLPACNLRGPLRPCEGDVDFCFLHAQEFRDSCDHDNQLRASLHRLNWQSKYNLWSHYPHYTALYHIINLGCNPSQAREMGDWVLPEHGRTQGWERCNPCMDSERERGRELQYTSLPLNHRFEIVCRPEVTYNWKYINWYQSKFWRPQLVYL